MTTLTSKLPADKRVNLSAIERFELSYIPEPNSGCWLWLGNKRSKKGYGSLSVNGVAVSAHRFSWELHNSKIPVGLHVCHRCDNPHCVNPAHLFLGTPRDNVMDMIRKNRNPKKKKTRLFGENASCRKLTESDVLKIRLDNRLHREIAKDYSITKSNVGLIKARKTWRRLNG